METVEVLVRIPKRDFEELQNNYVWWGKHGEYIQKGTVLPKGHGDLKDAHLIKEELAYLVYKNFHNKPMCDKLESIVDNVPTVIEADRDCEHCSRTYGTLGCCSTVNNKWIYSCEEGHREYEETHKEAELRTRHWIEDLSEYDNNYPKHIQAVWKCSECKKKQVRKSNYCPNCGARMAESEDKE